jgi:polypeptide N-acetylgalactosaminyltransferase
MHTHRLTTASPHLLPTNALARKAEVDRGFERNGFNQYVSDRVPLRRRAIDTRSAECLLERYPPLKHMPSTSVIVVFYNEAKSTLLRTAWSIVDRTPPSLLKEIILVDDGSSFEHLAPGELDADVALIPKTRVLRLPERVGLIQAKVRGVEDSTGDVVAFMDSHCEVNDGWLEPLLAEIVRNPRAVAQPLIDPIHYDTFHIGQAIAEIGVFSWSLEFRWQSPPSTKTDKVTHLTPFFSAGRHHLFVFAVVVASGKHLRYVWPHVFLADGR